MSEDARFEDGGERPLRLRALDAEDLAVVSSLVQDAVVPAGEMRWDRKSRRFALLVNRFRWEDAETARTRGRGVERVQAVLLCEEVTRVQSQGVDPRQADMVLSLLSVSFEPDPEPPGGRVVLTFAGDGAVAVVAEALDVVMRDVTRPHLAPSGHMPEHES